MALFALVSSGADDYLDGIVDLLGMATSAPETRPLNDDSDAAGDTVPQQDADTPDPA
jgi:hypothetical protein